MPTDKQESEVERAHVARCGCPTSVRRPVKWPIIKEQTMSKCKGLRANLYTLIAAARQLALRVFEETLNRVAEHHDAHTPESIRTLPPPAYLQEPNDADR